MRRLDNGQHCQFLGHIAVCCIIIKGDGQHIAHVQFFLVRKFCHIIERSPHIIDQTIALCKSLHIQTALQHLEIDRLCGESVRRHSRYGDCQIAPLIDHRRSPDSAGRIIDVQSAQLLEIRPQRSLCLDFAHGYGIIIPLIRCVVSAGNIDLIHSLDEVQRLADHRPAAEK